ncbi:mechanosensitive ion channel family protein [Mesorhizobium sp. WSM2239]|uniref:Mechanosensitive ion channel family protein n=2 Tax=unclassified Mesorhizobium TaxID=325217 RepID=A0AAU8DHW3_9HYPH
MTALRISRLKSQLFAICVITALSSAWLVITGSASLAQTATPSANEKVQEFIELLDDPEVRAWLESRPVPPADTASAPAASKMAAWNSMIRNHLVALGNAFPRIPGEAANAVRIVKAEINNRGFATILVIFAALLALGFGAEWLFRRATAERSPERSRAAKLLSELTPPVVFSLVSAGVFLAFEWPRLLNFVILTYLAAFIVVRLVMAVGRILLAPDGGTLPAEQEKSLRLISASDAEANFWYRRVAVFTAYLMAGWATVSLLPALGFSPDGRRLVAYLLGIGLLMLAIEMVWHRPGSTPATQRIRTKEWLLTIYLVILWGFWVAGLNGVLWLGIYALLLPKALTIAGQAAQALTAGPENAISAPTARTVIVVRGARALVFALAAFWLVTVWRVSPFTLLGHDSAANQIVRGVLQGIIILLVADLLWHLAKAYINRKLEMAALDDTVSPAEAARRSRLRTLLPIFRNMFAVLVATVAVLMALSGLGVQIGPLIAGAGIFGVAIGFGSQTLVKDVLSGVFFMLDDAFRVGEYIQSGSYKGTVESFSLRSVRLRHHRGPVFTVPFGALGAVQNMSRDWVIDKFRIRVAFDTDVKKVKKLLKGIGAEMLADPELAPHIIETVKLKGVEQFDEFGMELSFAVMTKPGQQSVVRRRAYTMIQQAFMENGVAFAKPSVQVGGDERQAAAAAAASAISLAREKAARTSGGEAA